MKVAVQLFTLRDYVTSGEDLYETLRKCRDLGYDGVQASAVGCLNGDEPEVSPEQAKEWLDEFDLVCCATHRPWDRLRDKTECEINFHKALGCDYAGISGLFSPDPILSVDFRQFLSEARPVIEKLKASGIRFGYHNHWHEYLKDPSTGVKGYDLLIDEGAPDLHMLVDTYWINHAGASPETLLKRCSGRIAMVHLKDKEYVHGEGMVMAPVGEGNLDWPEILSACEAGGTEWLIVEQDTCRRDPFDCLRSSRKYLRSLGY